MAIYTVKELKFCLQKDAPIKGIEGKKKFFFKLVTGDFIMDNAFRTDRFL